MTLELKWHLTCPSAQTEEVLALINSFHPAVVLNRNDFQRTKVSSITLAFEGGKFLGSGDLRKIFNQRNFDSMMASVKTTLKERYGDAVGFYPVTGGYELPTIKPRP